MRERYLEAFDRIWIDCLNGDKFKTGKLTPTASPTLAFFRQKSIARESRLGRQLRCWSQGRLRETKAPTGSFFATFGADQAANSCSKTPCRMAKAHLPVRTEPSLLTLACRSHLRRLRGLPAMAVAAGLIRSSSPGVQHEPGPRFGRHRPRAKLEDRMPHYFDRRSATRNEDCSAQHHDCYRPLRPVSDSSRIYLIAAWRLATLSNTVIVRLTRAGSIGIPKPSY